MQTERHIQVLRGCPEGIIDRVIVRLLGIRRHGNHRPARFQRELTSLISRLRLQLGPVPIVLAAVPEVGRFPILPQPLRVGLGLRAQAFNIAMRRLTDLHPRLTLVTAEFAGGLELLCDDQFHPSTLGYQQWGQQMGSHISKLIQHRH